MAEENEKSGMNLKSIIILGLVMIIIAAGTSFGLMTFFNKSSSAEKEPEVKEEKETMGPTFELGDFVVNLAGSNGFQFIKASIVVELSEKGLAGELDKRNPQVRDLVITTLREQKLADIQEPGAEVIKNQLRTKLNQILHNGQIKSVWFTQLVVQ